uniref:hypothetical protein n=1 Tax=Paenibacillus curdlanolyticus TaxID=59840 RepID=UPI0002F7BD0A|nr:hypothetical protein [Paenibacillus curdlanolyticus]
MNQLTEAYNQLDKYTKATQGEHVLPKFNIDVQNELVVNAKTNVWLAIEDANREAAAYYFNQGLKPLSDGATLNIRQMVPNLDTINWAAKAWAKEQKLRVEQYNKEVDAADIKRMQEALKKLDLYDGPITGKYDKDFLMDVVFFQQLVVMGAVEGSVKASLDDIATDGKITKSLLNLAQNATIVNPDRVIPGFGREMMQAIHKGRVEQIEANVDEYAELASRLNPFSSRLYTETLPGMAKVLTEISRNSTLQAELNKAMANTLMKDYVEPMKQMYDFAVHVATGKATYGEAKQFGRNLEKVLEGIAIACLTEGVGAALAKVAPKLVEGLADAGKAIVKRKAEEEVVKGGPGVNTPIDEFDDSEIYEGAGASRYNYTKVVDLENSIRYESKEHGQFFDSDGNSNGVMIIGTENSIDLSPYRKLGKNAVFTHNHPKNRTFSWQDLETAIEFDMAEIRAVSPNGATISMKRGAKGWTIDSRSAFDVLKDTQSIFRNDPEIQELYKAGKMDEINDILMREVARKIGGEYTALRK